MNLREDQEAVLDSTAKIRVGMMGRRWGKTLACLEALKRALDADLKVYYVVPNYGMIDYLKRQYYRIYSKTAPYWCFLTTERLKGLDVDLLIVDEAAFCSRDCLYVRFDKILLMSTPDYGWNWYEGFFLANLFNLDAECFYGTTWDNFLIHRDTIPEHLYNSYHYQKEFLAYLG